MNAPADFFPELIPATYADNDDARALALGMIRDWFGALSYAHNESTHAEILDSLDWQGMPSFVSEAFFCVGEGQIDFDVFADGVRHEARLARRAGLVVPDGKPRARMRPADATGRLFADDESGVMA